MSVGASGVMKEVLCVREREGAKESKKIEIETPASIRKRRKKEEEEESVHVVCIHILTVDHISSCFVF